MFGFKKRKKISVISEAITPTISTNTFVVRWHSVIFEGLRPFTRPESDVFSNEIEAKKFSQALMDAAHLLRITNLPVTIEPNKYKS